MTPLGSTTIAKPGGLRGKRLDTVGLTYRRFDAPVNNCVGLSNYTQPHGDTHVELGDSERNETMGATQLTKL